MQPKRDTISENRSSSLKESTGGSLGFRTIIIPVGLTLAVQALVSMIAVAVPVIMPVVSEELDFSPAYVGIFVTLIYTGATVSAPMSGYFIDRFGPILVSQICLLFSGLGLAFISISSIPWMVVGVLIIGIGYGPVTPASSYLLVRITPPSIIAMIFSIKQTGVPLGGALAGAVIPLLVLRYGWRPAIFLVVGFSLLFILSMQAFRNRYDRDLPDIVQFNLGQLIAPLKITIMHSDLRRVVVASFFFATMQLCLISFLVTYLTQDIGMTLVEAGFILSVAQFSGIVGRIVWGTMADRYFNPGIMLGFLGIAMAGGALLSAFFHAGWPYSLIMLVYALFGSVAIGWNGVYLAEVARLVKREHAAMATGGSLFFTFCGVLIGLPIFSMIVDKAGSYPAGFISAAIFTAACGVLLCFSQRRKKR